MLERWTLIFTTLMVTAVGLFLLRRKSPTNLSVVGVTSAAMMAIFYPLMTTWIEPLTWRNLDQLPESTLVDTQIQYLIFSVGLILACFISAPFGWLREDRPHAERESGYIRFRDTWASMGLIAFGAVLYAGYVQRVGFNSLFNYEDNAEKYLVGSGLGILVFGLNLIIAGALWAEIGTVSKLTRSLGRLAALAVSIWSFAFISTRTYFFIVFVGYLYIFCLKRGMQVRRIRIRVIAVLVLAFLTIEGYMIVRGAYTGDIGEAFTAVSELGVTSNRMLGSFVGGSEFTHPFVTAMEVFRFEDLGSLMGGSYFDSFTIFIPKALLPDRPLSLSEQFVRDYYPAVAARGGGTAFSIVAESYWNFGSMLGPLLMGTVFGVLLLWLEDRRRLGPDRIVTRVLPYAPSIVLLAHRNTFALILKQSISLLLPVVVLLVAAQMIWLAGRKPSPRDQRSPSPSRSSPRVAG